MAYCLRSRCPKSSKTSHSFGFILSSRFLFIQGKRCRQYAILSKRLTQYGRKAWTQNRAYAAFHLVKRRPPRPKPNENPSPYVVRLSLCYGIGKTQHAPLWFSPRFAASGKILRLSVCRKTSPLSASFVRLTSLIRKIRTANFIGNARKCAVLPRLILLKKCLSLY